MKRITVFGLVTFAAAAALLAADRAQKRPSPAPLPSWPSKVAIAGILQLNSETSPARPKAKPKKMAWWDSP